MCVLDALFEHCCQVQHCGSFRIPKNSVAQNDVFSKSSHLFSWATARTYFDYTRATVSGKRGGQRDEALQFGLLCLNLFLLSERVYINRKRNSLSPSHIKAA